jgi:hypothetical protein
LILCNQSDAERQKEGYATLASLLTREQPVTDLEIILKVDRFYHDARPPDAHKEVAAMWERAAKSRPKDENFFSAWYFWKFEQEEFHNAQKVRRTPSAHKPMGQN